MHARANLREFATLGTFLTFRPCTMLTDSADLAQCLVSSPHTLDVDTVKCGLIWRGRSPSTRCNADKLKFKGFGKSPSEKVEYARESL